MIMSIYKMGKPFTLVVILFLSIATSATAQQSEPLLNFKFSHLSNIQSINDTFQTSPNKSFEFVQYDATWTYPWEMKSMNIDLGVTLRHLSGFKYSTESSGNHYFQEVFPLLHASALFSLPLKGLYAGIEGSHHDSNDTQIFDYRAKVSYEWRNGFGLQGGWQHQQVNLDTATNLGAEFEKKGLYLDFYLNF
jgi:hypothetical protein